MMRAIISFLLLSMLAGCSAAPKKNESEFRPEQSGFVPVNGIEMYYEIYGQGPPLVLLHGGGSSIHVSFGRGIPELAKSFRVIAFDEQNHGRTRYYPRKFGFENTADDIAAALKILKVENAYFLGFSNGAMTGMHLAIRHPGLFSKMVLGSGVYQRGGTPSGFWKHFDNAALENMPKELQDEYVKIAPVPGDLRKMHDGDATRMRDFKDIPPSAIRKIAIPVLIMQNDQDVATPEHAVKVMRMLPKGRVAILPGPHDNYLGNDSADKPEMRAASLAVIKEFLK